MQLLTRIYEQGVSSVAVTGMLKNAGKTVSLKRIIAEARQAGIAVGLSSCGRDGEREDVIFRHGKPAVEAAEGTLVATARSFLAAIDGKAAVLADSGFNTVFGTVLIAKMLAACEVELAGPVFNSQLRVIVESLKQHGADLVLLDGAMDRVSSAAAGVAGGVILATGAGLAPEPQDVLRMTLARVEQFCSPAVEPENVELLSGAKGAVSLWLKDNSVKGCSLSSAIGTAHKIAGLIRPDVRAVVLKGALTDNILQTLYPYWGQVEFIVQDASKLLLKPEIWQEFYRKGRVRMLRPNKLLAVTVNPWSPFGWRFRPQGFLALARQVITQVPVFDVCQLPSV